MKSLQWFRLYAEAVDDEKLRLLAFEDRWHFVALLCCKARGILDEASPEALTQRKVAVKLGLDARELGEVARRLAAVGLIDERTYQPLAWDERQYQSDTSTERVRAYRERMKQTRNVSETAQETETETETETEKPRERPRASRFALLSLPEGWRQYCQMQRQDLDPNRVFEDFRDYWTAKPGREGTKLDWTATWQRWVRNEKAGGGRRLTSKEIADEAIRIMERREREDHAEAR